MTKKMIAMAQGKLMFDLTTAEMQRLKHEGWRLVRGTHERSYWVRDTYVEAPVMRATNDNGAA